MAAHKKPKPKPKVTAREKKTLATRAAFNKVCDLIADGPKESVKEITMDRKIGISRSGFYHLLRGRDDELLDRYAQARAVQADRFAGEIIEIADKADADTKVVLKKGCKGDKAADFEVHTDHEIVNRSRLKIDTRKWLAARLDPTTYGERQAVDMNLTIEKMDDAELLARAKKLAAGLGITLPPNLLKPAGHRSDRG